MGKSLIVHILQEIQLSLMPVAMVSINFCYLEKRAIGQGVTGATRLSDPRSSGKSTSSAGDRLEILEPELSMR